MGYLFDAYLEMTKSYILTGDLAQAETYLRRNEALIITGRTSGIPLWREGYEHLGHAWESSVHTNRAILLEARGQYRAGEG
jgi:hypothetical protein